MTNVTIVKETVFRNYIAEVQDDPDGSGAKQLDVILPATGEVLSFPMDEKGAKRLADKLDTGLVQKATMLDLPDGVKP